MALEQAAGRSDHGVAHARPRAGHLAGAGAGGTGYDAGRAAASVRLARAVRVGGGRMSASGNASPAPVRSDHPLLSLLHVAGGGCGGCALELEAIPNSAWAAIGLRLTASPRHADLLLVSGCVTKALLRAVESCWAAMAEPKRLVAVGACALDGGPFRGNYAVGEGLGGRLPVALAIGGCPPTPAVILAELRQLPVEMFGGGDRSVTPDATVPAVSPPALPQALLPAAPRRPLAGGDSSGG